MKKILLVILAILTISVGLIEARSGGRGGGGRGRGGRAVGRGWHSGGRGWHGGGWHRGYRGGYGYRRGGYWGNPYWYSEYPWYYPYSYTSYGPDVVYVEKPEDQSTQLKSRIVGLEGIMQGKKAEGDVKMVKGLQSEIANLNAQLAHLEGSQAHHPPTAKSA